MTNHADSWLLVLIVPAAGDDVARVVVGSAGVARELVERGVCFNLDSLFDDDALRRAPTGLGWHLWYGSVRTVDYAEDSFDQRWIGIWTSATAEDLAAFGVSLPGGH